MPSGLANKGGFAKNRGKVGGVSAAVPRVLRAGGTFRLDLHDWQLVEPSSDDPDAWRAHVGRRVWVQVGLNPYRATVTAEKPRGTRRAGYLGAAWCPRTCWACKAETLGMGPDHEVCARCGRAYGSALSAVLAGRDAATVPVQPIARPAYGGPDDPRCGSQGVRADGRCLRCGLEPRDPARLDDDAASCPPGFLAPRATATRKPE